MSTATTQHPPTTAWRKHRWTTAEYDAMIASGYLREGSKTFLWDGEIIEPMPENEPHANARDNLHLGFIRLLPEGEWTVRPAHPLALRDGYKPQPDLVVLVGPRSEHRGRSPTPANVALVVEISDSTYAEDAGDKLPEYASAGIPCYWIVHLRARRIETYGGPDVASGVGRYTDRRDFLLGESVLLILHHGGLTLDLGVLAVLDVLRDSLEEVE